MIYRKTKQGESKSLASIHNTVFNGFFLTSLGLDFLETYYKACLNNKSSIAICAVDDNDEIKGFATGSIRAKGYHRTLFFNNAIQFVFSIIKKIIVNPKVLLRLAWNLDKTTKKFDDKNYAELLSIAVLPELKGSGIGKHLLNLFEKEVKKKGGLRVTLTTDFDNNDSVINFYLKCNYTIYYDFFTYPNRHMLKMTKSFSEG